MDEFILAVDDVNALEVCSLQRITDGPSRWMADDIHENGSRLT